MEMEQCLFAFWLGLRSPDSRNTAGLTRMTLGIDYANSVIVCFYASIAMITGINSILAHFNSQSAFCRTVKALAVQGCMFAQVVIPPPVPLP